MKKIFILLHFTTYSSEYSYKESYNQEPLLINNCCYIPKKICKCIFYCLLPFIIYSLYYFLIKK